MGRSTGTSSWIVGATWRRSDPAALDDASTAVSAGVEEGEEGPIVNGHRILWGLQILLGAQFVLIGMLHLFVPEGLPGPLGWMYDLSDTQHAISGSPRSWAGSG